jgi:DNA-binding NtrC family response regulator
VQPPSLNSQGEPVISNELVLDERPLDQPIPVLIVSANEDHAKVHLLLNPVDCLFYGASTFAEARKILQDHVIAVVVTETDLADGRWTTLVACTAPSANPPYIIPLADLGDYEFWTEAINHGAFDVLYRPFVKTSIARAVTLAFQRWKRGAERQEARAERTQVTMIWPSRKSKTSRSRWFGPRVLAADQKFYAKAQRA